MPEAITRRQYPTAPTSVALARADCRDFLASWGLPDDANNAASDFVLLVSELVTNAVTHGRVPGASGRHVGFALEKLEDTFRVEVRDTQGDTTPHECMPEAEAETGRGLLMVGWLSDKWGVRPEVIGKTVWAEKRMP